MTKNEIIMVNTMVKLLNVCAILAKILADTHPEKAMEFDFMFMEIEEELSKF